MMKSAKKEVSEEQAVIQGMVDHDYDEFIRDVAQSRNLTTNRVDEIAQGRVWSGADAVKIGMLSQPVAIRRRVSFGRMISSMSR